MQETSTIMNEEAFYDYLDQYSTIASQSAQDSRECYDFDSELSFRCQLFEDDSDLSNVQSSVIVGIL